MHNEVRKLKRACGGRLDSGTTEQDLLQEGCISLLRAAEKFDVDVGVRFSTYATFWVRAAIKRAWSWRRVASHARPLRLSPCWPHVTARAISPRTRRTMPAP